MTVVNYTKIESKYFLIRRSQMDSVNTINGSKVMPVELAVHTTLSERKHPMHLSQEEQRVLRELKARDREVRAHENAHKTAGSGLVVSGPNYTYQTGPDGKRYAIGGDVKLDTSKIPNDPEATMKKADKIRRAALAPSEPSAQDLKVARQANVMKQEAQRELREEEREEKKTEEKEKNSTNTYDQFGKISPYSVDPSFINITA